MIVIVMGVSGSGKTHVGSRVAKHLGWRFIEGDDFHPPANITKMRAGIPLDDADREPWLTALRQAIDSVRATDEHVVLACSALKRSYRRALGSDRADVVLTYLAADERRLRDRVAQRHHQFMPASLLSSQFAALEPPGDDEHPLRLDASKRRGKLVKQIAREIRIHACALRVMHGYAAADTQPPVARDLPVC